MSYTVSITSQGQISIPIRIREELGLGANKKAIVSVENGRVILEPVRDLLALRGSVKTDKKALSLEKLHEQVAVFMADDYAKKLDSTS